METINVPISLATDLVADKIKSLKGDSLNALAEHIIRRTSGNLENFFKYIKDPEGYSTEDFAIGGNVLCKAYPLPSSHSNYLIDKGLSVEIEGDTYLTVKLVAIDFFADYNPNFLVEYVYNNKKTTYFVQENYLKSADLL